MQEALMQKALMQKGINNQFLITGFSISINCQKITKANFKKIKGVK
ncbi:hypothetical protein IQ232_13445 [Microcystis aeruginosa LEGE 11464]|jgi:hypothetical protein|nr:MULTISPECIES: hypothetical protein [Microcystis]MBE9090744.1 hypothetical protein [Microcystis aeruginosa LEGE 11464]MCA2658910.1 hypothetical protein [Microcystis sp. M049S2]MCZ8128381.1 hypothetical protein [Microcystis sp. LE19-114.1B]